MDRTPTGLEFICPKDHASLEQRDGDLFCPACLRAYPINCGIPILIDDDCSLFSSAALASAKSPASTGYWKKGTGLQRQYRKLIGRLQNHTVHIRAFLVKDALKLIFDQNANALVLVVGAANNDFGDQRIVYSDVTFGKNVSVILDAHSIPFPDSYFDAVIVYAVLEHVPDPWKCAREITRVIAPKGYVYSSIPFLQPVHMGAYDFTRFTYLGHRRLFSQFREVFGGPEMGPATSAAFALQHVFLCVSNRPTIRRIMRLIGILLGEVLKTVDYLFRNRAGTLDAAASTYFFGQKLDHAIPDRELLTMYRGAQ